MVGNDFLARQGTRAFATRLRRLHEKLTQSLGAFYRDSGIDFEPRWFGLTTLVREHGHIEITQAATALGQSHVSIVQVANALEERGLIRRVTSRSDKRRRALAITPKGKALCKRLDPLWNTVRRATDQLLEEASPDFLANLGALEQALAEKSIDTRIRELLPKKGCSS